MKTRHRSSVHTVVLAYPRDIISPRTYSSAGAVKPTSCNAATTGGIASDSRNIGTQNIIMGPPITQNIPDILMSNLNVFSRLILLILYLPILLTSLKKEFASLYFQHMTQDINGFLLVLPL